MPVHLLDTVNSEDALVVFVEFLLTLDLFPLAAHETLITDSLHRRIALNIMMRNAESLCDALVFAERGDLQPMLP